jgi:hypothetical protein
MSFLITATISSKIGFASHQNAAPVIGDLHVRGEREGVAENCRLVLRADPPFLAEKAWRLTHIGVGDDIAISDRDVQLTSATSSFWA